MGLPPSKNYSITKYDAWTDNISSVTEWNGKINFKTQVVFYIPNV